MFGWVIGLFVDWNMSLVWGASATIVFIAPAVAQQYWMDLRSALTEEERKQRDQPSVIGLVLCAGVLSCCRAISANWADSDSPLSCSQPPACSSSATCGQI